MICSHGDLPNGGRRSGGDDRKDFAMISGCSIWKRLIALLPLLFFLVLPAFAGDRNVGESVVPGTAFSMEGSKAEIIDQFVEAAKRLDHEGKYDEALGLYNRAIALSPEDAVLYFERGSHYYVMMISSGPEPVHAATSPASFPAAAEGSSGGPDSVSPGGQYCRLALADFNRAISLNKNFDIFFYMRGSLLVSDFCPQRDAAKAIADFERAIRINPANAVYYLERGNAYAGLSQYNSAVADIRKAISMEPNNYYFYHDIGMIYERMQMSRDAIENYKKAMELAPPDQMPPLNHSLTLVRGNKDRDLIGDYTELIAKRPEVAYLYINRGNRLGDEGKLRQAIEDYSTAITLRQDKDEPYFTRGKMFYELGQKKDALMDFRASCDRGNIGACCYQRIAEEDLERGKGWIPFWYSRDQRRYFYDRTIRGMEPGKARMVRVLIEPDKTTKNNTTGDGKEAAGADERPLILQRWEINCLRRQVRAATQRKFDREGRQIAYDPKFEPYPRPVFPGGISDRLFQIVCRKGR